MTCRQALCLAVALIALCLLTGCLGRTQTETGSVSGVVAGQPVVIKWTRDTQGQTTLDLPPALLEAAAAGASATSWGALIAGGVSLAMAVIAGRQSGVATVQTARANEHKADADEAWNKLAPK